MSRPNPRATITRAPGTAGRPSSGSLYYGHAGRRVLNRFLPLVWILLSASCAIQGPPLPPRVERPQQVSDLSVAQKGRTFELSFTLPTLATDRERLTKPMDIEIFESVTPLGAAPAPFSESASPAAILKPAEVHPLMLGGKVVYPWKLTDKEYSSSLGGTYSFAIRGVTYGFRHRVLSGRLSDVARATLLDVSGPVQNLRARTTEKSIELEWSAPARTLTGAQPVTLVGYRVYRSPSGKPGSFALRTATTSPAYSDSDFTFGQTYFYEVQARFERGHAAAESEESPATEITPRDTFPPEAPRNVNAIYSPGAVEIVWTPSAAADLAGYNVLRSEGAGTGTRINKQLVPTPVYRDSTVETGHRYLYRITAVDLAGNESPPSAPAEVETR